jgi:hypothetical protein
MDCLSSAARPTLHIQSVRRDKTRRTADVDEVHGVDYPDVTQIHELRSADGSTPIKPESFRFKFQRPKRRRCVSARPNRRPYQLRFTATLRTAVTVHSLCPASDR